MPWKIECAADQRARFLHEWQKRKSSVAELCRRYAISRKTGYKWIARLFAEGRRGLVDKPRIAQCVRNRTSRQWLARIRRWRGQRPSWGARKVHARLKRKYGGEGLPSTATIGRWLKMWGLTCKPKTSRHRGPTVERPNLTIALEANEVWSVDFKGWFRTADRTKILPLTIRDMATCYIIAVRLLRSQSIADTKHAFAEVFGEYGLPLAIRVDNGSPFGSLGARGLTQLSAWWIKLGIRVEFIAPGQPGQNAAHEQMHKVYKAEVASPPAPTLRAQKWRTSRWRRIYNHERPHETLSMCCPAEYYRKSRRKLPTRLRHWKYPRGWNSRLVKGKGMISLHGKSRFVGEAFERERVGLKRTADGWNVYFGTLLIGVLKADENTGIHAIWLRRRRGQNEIENVH